MLNKLILLGTIAAVSGCVEVECTNTDDCNGDDICVDEECVECAEDTDCDANEVCDDGDCSRDGGDEGEGEEGEGEEGEGEEGEGEEGEGEGEEGEGEEGEGEGEVPDGPDTLHAIITWTVPNDVDIHLTKRNGNQQFCVGSTSSKVTLGPQASGTCASSEFDCNYASCASSFGSVEWDGVGGQTAGDPELIQDELSAPGPEDIRVLEVSEGEYLFGAFYFSGQTNATVVTGRLTLGGEQIYTGSAPLDATTRWQELAIVVVDANQTVCVEDLLDGSATDDCP